MAPPDASILQPYGFHEQSLQDTHPLAHGASLQRRLARTRRHMSWLRGGACSLTVKSCGITRQGSLVRLEGRKVSADGRAQRAVRTNAPAAVGFVRVEAWGSIGALVVQD